MNETDLVKQAAVELGVDKPIMSYKVVGNRVELHLLGGSVAVWTRRSPGPYRRRAVLSRLSTKELRRQARLHEIRGRSKMSRSQLIDAIELAGQL